MYISTSEYYFSTQGTVNKEQKVNERMKIQKHKINEKKTMKCIRF